MGGEEGVVAEGFAEDAGGGLGRSRVVDVAVVVLFWVLNRRRKEVRFEPRNWSLVLDEKLGVGTGEVEKEVCNRSGALIEALTWAFGGDFRGAEGYQAVDALDEKFSRGLFEGAEGEGVVGFEGDGGVHLGRW